MTDRDGPDPAVLLDVFQHSSSMVAIINVQGSLTYVNPAWSSGLGRERTEPTQTSLTALAHPDDRTAVAVALTWARCDDNDDSKAGGEHRFAHGDGGWRTLAWGATRASDSTGTLIIDASDVGRQRRIEAELEELVACIAHDLRAPLRAIDGFARLLLSGDAAPDLPDDAQRAMSLISEASRELAVRLDALVDVGRIGHGPAVSAAVDVTRIARDLVDFTMRPRQGLRDVRWMIDDVPPTLGDPALVRMLLAALLDNALRFSAARAPAHIALRWDASERAYVITDDGEGFDDARFDRALAIFGRLGLPGPGAGPGVGLALARRIVALHDGRLWARSRPGAGAALWFSLRPVPEPAPAGS